MRKSRLSTFVLVFLSLIAFEINVSAQTEKGGFYVGGSADISELFNSSSGATFNFSVGPTIAVFVVKNFAVGAHYSFAIGSSRFYNNYDGQYESLTTFTTNVGPTFRYYLGKKQLKGVASANVNYSVYTGLIKSSVYNTEGYSAGGTLGMAYFFNAHISLETVAYFTASAYKSAPQSNRTGLSIALYAFLDKKKRE